MKLQSVTNKLFVSLLAVSLLVMTVVSFHILWVQLRSFDSYVNIDKLEVKLNESTQEYDFHLGYTAKDVRILFSVSEVQDANNPDWKMCSDNEIVTVEPSFNIHTEGSHNGHSHSHKGDSENIVQVTPLYNLFGFDCISSLKESGRELQMKVYYHMVVDYNITKRITKLSNVFSYK